MVSHRKLTLSCGRSRRYQEAMRSQKQMGSLWPTPGRTPASSPWVFFACLEAAAHLQLSSPCPLVLANLARGVAVSLPSSWLLRSRNVWPLQCVRLQSGHELKIRLSSASARAWVHHCPVCGSPSSALTAGNCPGPLKTVRKPRTGSVLCIPGSQSGIPLVSLVEVRVPQRRCGFSQGRTKYVAKFLNLLS